MSVLGMRLYTVHIKPGAPQAGESPVFVKEGFNWWAFLLMFMWALYQRLWVAAAALFALNMLMIWLADAHALTHTDAAILQLAIQILVGFHANDWLRARLQRKGYVLADIAAGDTLLRAEQRYFERYLSAV